MINAHVLLRHFDRISEASDAIARLRRFVVDLAIRGKLTDHDDADQPATQLLSRISAEKAATPGQSKQHSSVARSDARYDFSLPPTWCWAQLSQICLRIHYGLTASADSDSVGVRLLRITDIQNSAVNWDTVPGCDVSADDASQFLIQRGDILIARTGGTIGKTFLVGEVPRPSAFASYLIRAQPSKAISSGYIKRFCESSLYWDQLQEGSRGAGQPNVNGQTLGQINVPIPPLAEQGRIVARIDELMALCDQLAEAHKEREARRVTLTAASHHCLKNEGDILRKKAQFFINHLPTLTTRPDQIKGLRQSILSLAVRGKLVPQCAGDEPASKLLDHVRSSSHSPSVAGSVTRRKPTLTPVDVLLAPFDIPSNWTWARFPELGTFGRGKSKHRPRNDGSLFDGGTHPLVQTGDVARSKGVIRTYTGMYNDVGLAQSQMWPAGTLCITIAANIADSGILKFDACFPDSVVGFVPAPEFPNARYFEYFLRTAKENLLEFAPATAQKNINLEILNAVLIPLPPLAEQVRIVERVDQLMHTCDQLEEQLSSVRTARSTLLEAVLHEALAGLSSRHEVTYEHKSVTVASPAPMEAQ